jgi:hypothetical protein
MPFDPTDFLKVARDLDTPPAKSNEAQLRAAFGRAYYSAYLVARDRLAAVGHTRPRYDASGVHEWLLQKLTTAKRDPEIQELGDILASLFDGRRLADYDIVQQAPYAPGKGYNQAVRAEQWIRDFNKISDDRLRNNIRS